MAVYRNNTQNSSVWIPYWTPKKMSSIQDTNIVKKGETWSDKANSPP